MYTLNFH